MKNRIATGLLVALVCGALPSSALAADRHRPLGAQTMPDQLELSDGKILRGLILHNTADRVLFQTEEAERVVPKEHIRRIHDEMEGELVFPELLAPGRLPSWRAMVFDLRANDAIRGLQQIPSAAIAEGYLRNIPYLSFRVNEQSAFNVYGDPHDPVAIEFGMYGRQRGNAKYHRIVREFLAGHLQSREQIAALYALSFAGGEKKAGPLTLRVTPPAQAGPNGGWWIALYNPARLDGARVGDGPYARVTLPFGQISHRDGRLREETLRENANWLAGMVKQLTGTVPKVRGFYRDDDGVFRLIGFGTP
jgi:hypothetical protein